MLQRPTDESNPADRFALASDRLRAARVFWRQEGLTASGIELLQEAVERYFKGFLIANGWRLVKTHDLEVLLQEAIVRDARFDQFRPLAMELTEDFFAQQFYPGEDLTSVGQNFATHLGQTEQLAKLIEHLLPQFFPQSPPE
jgi:HEPN domain-containing protein